MDDEFLNKFREMPRGEFTRKLYEQLLRGDEMMNHKLILSDGQLLEKPNMPRQSPLKPHWAALVAAMLVLAILSIPVFLPHSSQSSEVMLPEQLGTLQPITLENVNQLTLLKKIGRGIISDDAWSPDGKTIALAGAEGVWLHNAENLQSEPPRFLASNADKPLTSIVFSPDGKLIAAGAGRVIDVWNIETGSIKIVLTGHTNTVRSVAFSPDGMLLASGSGDENTNEPDYSIRIWDIETGQEKRTISGQSAPIINLLFSPNGKILASENMNRKDAANLWDVESGQLLHTLTRSSGNLETSGLAFSPDGKTIALADGVEAITAATLWDANTGKKKGAVIIPNQSNLFISNIRDLAFSPDGQQLAITTNTLLIWNLQAKAFIPTLSPSGDNAEYISDYRLAFSSDGLSIVTIRNKAEVSVINLQTNQKQTVPSYGGEIKSLALTPDNQSIVYVIGDGIIHSYDVETGNEESLDNNIRVDYPLTFSSDASVVASQGIRVVTLFDHPLLTNPGIRLMDVKTGQELITLSSGANSYSAVVFSPDDSLLVSIVSDTQKSSVYRWYLQQIQSNLSLMDQSGGYLSELAFSPDSQLLAVGGRMQSNQGVIYLIDPLSGRLMNTVVRNESVGGLLFSRNGKTLAAGSNAGILLIDSQKGDLVGQLKGDYEYVNPLAFNHDSKLLITATNRGFVIWNTDNSQHNPLAIAKDYIDAVVSSDWHFIITTGSDGIIRIWGIPS